MKRFSISIWILSLSLAVGACGGGSVPEATATVNALDLQSTVAAAAFTVIAETVAAIPTATPIPPTPTFTDTPLPTNTVPPLPSLQGSSTPGPNASGGGDPCLTKVLPPTLRGDPIRMRVENSTRATVSLSVYLNQAGPNSECGYRSYSLAPGDHVVISNLVAACYTLWAWNPDPDDYFIVTNGTSCLDTSNTWVFDISTGSLKLKQ